jgi:hypothetical protein
MTQLASERNGKRKSRFVEDTEQEIKGMIAHDKSLSDADRAKLSHAAKNVADEWAKHVAPKGALGLPALLDERRIEYGIVDAAFSSEAVFDRIYVWQVDRQEGDTYEGTSILRPDSAKDRHRTEAAYGIIVSAGMAALDHLRSNGIDLGHLVKFIRSSPWRMYIGNVAGIEVPPLMVMRDGDLVSSDDLARLRRAGKVQTVAVPVTNGSIEHRIQNPDGTSTAASMPWMSDDYC